MVHGPAPATWLPATTADDVREAARAELSGYWTSALRKRAIWREDVYVDLGLTVWARAEAAIDDVVRRRRAGEPVELSEAQREERAAVVRAFLRTEVAQGLPLGTGLPATFTTTELAWGPGDRVLLYTDGLSEARDERGEFLDLTTLGAALGEPDALDGVLDAVHQHVHGGTLGDDLAVVLLERQAV